VHDYFEHEGTPYIAMEYVPGETLRSVIKRQAELPLPRRIELVEGACAGLAHAHQAGVVHLDVKPDNLMLDDSGIVKVLDFGIARLFRSETPVTNHHVGTLRYMSPEQVSGDPLDRRSDVFSLGCSCFELVAYAPAYSGSTHELISWIAEGPVPRLLDVVPDVDPRLDAIIARAMAQNPSDRFEDLDHLRLELEQLRRHMDPGMGAHLRSRLVIYEAGSSSSRRRSKSRTAPWRPALSPWVGAGSVAVIGLGTLWAIGGRPAPESKVANVSAGAAPVVQSSVPSRPAASNGADDVWRRLALGDRPAVLRLLRPGTNEGPAADPRLAAAVIDAVRATVRQARDTAGATPAMRASETYRLAEGQLARANRFEADRKPLDALGALWQAGDLYGRVTVAGQPPSQTASVAIPPAPVADPSSGAPARVVHDPPAVPVEPPAATAAPPAAETPGPAAAPTATRTVPAGPSDTDAIVGALRKYHDAYRALDVGGVLQVFPTLAPNKVEELRRTFAAVTAYETEARQPQVNVVGDVATVRAVVGRRMVPRVGRPVANEVETEFRLHRTGTGWLITDVRAVKAD